MKYNKIEEWANLVGKRVLLIRDEYPRMTVRECAILEVATETFLAKWRTYDGGREVWENKEDWFLHEVLPPRDAPGLPERGDCDHLMQTTQEQPFRCKLDGGICNGFEKCPDKKPSESRE